MKFFIRTQDIYRATLCFFKTCVVWKSILRIKCSHLPALVSDSKWMKNTIRILCGPPCWYRYCVWVMMILCSKSLSHPQPTTSHWYVTGESGVLDFECYARLLHWPFLLSDFLFLKYNSVLYARMFYVLFVFHWIDLSYRTLVLLNFSLVSLVVLIVSKGFEIV